MSSYPTTAAGRDAFILARRPPRPVNDPWQVHGVTVEQEPLDGGGLADVVTVFLTGRECPWRCAMCDLWQYTIPGDTPAGALPHQIRQALGQSAGRLASGHPRHVKLYNAGSFFDPRAVPPGDYDAIAAEVAGFARVILESHPALVGERVDRFLESLARAGGGHGPALEVGMGLETAHPDALERLNKRMTVDGFRTATRALLDRGVAARAFLLVSPPFIPAREQDEWLMRSVDTAFDAGATAVSLIPMRAGNGAVEGLAAAGLYRAPTLDTLEDAMDAALLHARGRVFADVWDLGRLGTCDCCYPARAARLAAMNLTQRVLPRVSCPACQRVEASA